jgi:hypothetical protein
VHDDPTALRERQQGRTRTLLQGGNVERTEYRKPNIEDEHRVTQGRGFHFRVDEV